MWSDNEAKVDLLRFNYLCSSVNKIIMNDQLSPTTIGLFGDWGSGKSTLLNLSKLEVEKNKNALWVEFNGWLFEGYSDAKTALMGAILDQIKKRIENDKTIPEKTLDLVKKLSKKVNWFSVLVSSGKYAIPALAGMPHITAGIAIGDAVKFIREQVKDIPHAIEKIDEEKFKSFFKDSDEQTEDVRKSIREFREDFAKLINESKLERLVVSIDDLDRCLPDTVIETLEAIRLFLFVPKTVFLIAADERLVEYAVTKRFPKLPTGSNLDVGREYLEKMIQVPIRVPSLNPLDMKSYMNLLVAERHITDKSNFDKIVSHVKAFTDPTFSKCSFDLEAYKSIISTTVDAKIEEDFKLVNQVSGILTVGLNGSPRRIKRFLNTLLLRMEMATFKGISLRRDILAKIMLLEYLRPAFFKELANFQAKEDGKSLSLKDSEESVNKKELRKNSQPNQNWISDEWMQMWLKTEPLLADVDLRPYFYIAHDRLGSMGHLQNRMSPAAQTALSRLLSKEDITRKSAAKEIKGFAESDIGAIFDSLSERISRIEELDESVEEKAVELLIEAVPKLIPQVISMYSLMDVELVPLGTIVFLEKHCISTDSWPSCENLFKAWAAQNDNKVLKNAAAQRLKQAASAQGKK
jgi:predicted KAP-like P-loop ATPase